MPKKPLFVIISAVEASFAIDTYTLTYTAGANGSITGNTSQTVDYGGNGTEVTAVPATGYHFVQWSDNVMTASRTDTNVTGNITVEASFAIDTYTPTPTPTLTPTPTPAFSVASYDTNSDGIISKDEALKAIQDYFDGIITKDQVLEVVAAYLNSTPIPTPTPTPTPTP